MAKVKISQYDATAGNNTDIDSISIAEGMLPSNVNNALRELMAHLKDMDAGTQALTSPQLTSVDINGGTIDGAVIGGNSAAAISGTTLALSGNADLNGDLDVDGTTNLDVVDIDGAVNMATTALVTGVLTTTAATVFNGGFASNNVSTIIAADGAGDNAYALQIKNQESTDDRSYGVLIQAGSTAVDTPLNIATHDGGTSLFTMVGSGQAQFVDGTAALPAISNLGDLNTGMYFPSADNLAFSTGGVERAFLTATQLNVTGNAIFGGSAHTFAGSATVANNLTLTDGNLVVANGHGIDFSAQTATSQTDAGATNELLSHYEEGNWTPVMFSGSSTTQPTAYDNQQGRYVRVGSILHYQGRLKINGLGSVSGNPRIGGLPFTVINDGAYPATTIGWANGLNITAGQTIAGTPGPNTTAIELRIWNSAAGVSDMTAAEFSDDGDIIFSGTFEVV